MQRNAPITRGFEKKKLNRKSFQQTIDTLGVAFRDSVLDVDLVSGEIARAQEIVLELADQLINNPLGRSERLVLLADNFAVQIVTNEGFTQIAFSTRQARDKDCFQKLFDQFGAEDELLNYFLQNTKTSSAQRYIYNLNGNSTSRINIFDTYARFDIDTYKKIRELYELGFVISQQVASDENSSFVFACYEPFADIAKSQRVDFHRDKVDGSDTLTRSFSLNGVVKALVGIDSDCLDLIYRAPGDEIVMNYLDRGFPVRAPIHNFSNPNSYPVLNLVIDEYGLNGLSFLNFIGVFAPVQRDLMGI